MAGFSAQELSNLAVSLARLEYRPPDSWLDTFAAATAARMHSFEAQVSWFGRGLTVSAADCTCCRLAVGCCTVCVRVGWRNRGSTAGKGWV